MSNAAAASSNVMCACFRNSKEKSMKRVKQDEKKSTIVQR